jgi:sister-chromatid-cohesion protein PDS5
MYKLLKTCLDPQTDLKGLVKATVRPVPPHPHPSPLLSSSSGSHTCLPQHDFRKRLEQSSPGMLGTFNVLLRRGSLRLVNQSTIPPLLKRAQRASASSTTTALSSLRSLHLSDSQSQSQSQLTSVGESQRSAAGTAAGGGDAEHCALLVLGAAARHCPAIYKPHVPELAKALAADERSPRVVEVCLQALAAVARWDAGLVPSDK